jgi:hypothetical protein
MKMKFKQFLNIYHSFYKPESRARGVLILLMRLPGFLFYKPHPSPPNFWEGVWFVKNLIVLAFFIIHFFNKLHFARFPMLSPLGGTGRGLPAVFHLTLSFDAAIFPPFGGIRRGLLHSPLLGRGRLFFLIIDRPAVLSVDLHFGCSCFGLTFIHRHSSILVEIDFFL